MLTKQIPPADRHAIIRDIVDAYNDMLQSLQAANAGKFVYVSVRGTATTEKDWRDELHLNDSTFRKVASKIATAALAL